MSPVITGGKVIEGSDPVGEVSATGTIGAYRMERVDATSGAITRTLPPVASSKYLEFTITKVDSSANAVTIAEDSGDSNTINGVSSLELSAQYESVTLISNGSAWTTK